MRDIALYILAVLVGLSILTVSMAYYENSKLAQKVESIEKLNNLKRSLELDLSIDETKVFIINTQRSIDSINSIEL